MRNLVIFGLVEAFRLMSCCWDVSEQEKVKSYHQKIAKWQTQVSDRLQVLTRRTGTGLLFWLQLFSDFWYLDSLGLLVFIALVICCSRHVINKHAVDNQGMNYSLWNVIVKELKWWLPVVYSQLII